MNAFEDSLRVSLGIEGGLADRGKAADPGGRTNLGVTEARLAEYLADHPEDHDMPARVDALTRDLAGRIYRVMDWDRHKCGKMPPWLALMTFDASIHHGYSRAAKWAQESVGAAPDGIIGDKTLAQAWRASPESAILRFMGERCWYLHTRPHADANPGWFKDRIIRITATATRWSVAHEHWQGVA